MLCRRKIKSVVITGGQGDVIMSINGMIALMNIAPSAFSSDIVVYTRSVALPIVNRLIPNIKVKEISASKHAPRPRYYTSSSTSWTTMLRNWLYPDYYVDFDERTNLWVYGRPEVTLSKKVYLRLTALRFGISFNIKHEEPVYYGLKMWLPLALSHGVDEIQLYRALFKAYYTLPHSLIGRAAGQIRSDAILVAIFPGAGSYQYIPASFIVGVMSDIGVSREQFCCYFEEGDPLIDQYQKADMRTAVTEKILDAVSILKKAKVVITPDSFLSHLAQLFSNNHVALMTHNFPANTVHPAARSYVCYYQIDCSPCYYQNRSVSTSCPKGYDYCKVYDVHEYKYMVKRYLNMLV